MRTIELYTESDAIKDQHKKHHTPKSMSVFKWKMIIEAYKIIHQTICTPCGLCIVRKQHCAQCPITEQTGVACTFIGSPYHKAHMSLTDSITKAQKVLLMLEQLPDEPENTG